ncbi:MAG: helix-turn-helix domain-containing protein [Ignavibacteriales bacterium]
MKQEKNTKAGNRVTPVNGRLLTVGQACQIYGLAPTLIYHWLRYKKFDRHKVGKKVLFWEADLLNFLEQHKVKKSEELEM